MRSLQQFWSVRRIAEDRVTLARLGPLRLWLARADREWGFSCNYGEELDLMDFAQVPEDVVPDELKWETVLFKKAPRDYLFEASAPSLPLVVRTMGHLSLPGGESGSFFLVVPVVIGIRVLSDGNSQSIGTVATQKFPRSWFGTTVNGRFAHANPAPLLLDSGQVRANPNQIVYPLEIRNASSKMLRFDRICLDLRQTGIFSGRVHLWGSPLKIEFHGANRECPVVYSDTVPESEMDLLEVVAPRQKETRELARAVISCCNSG